MGYCYHHGLAVKRDEEKALEYYQASANQGDALAQYELGKSLAVIFDETPKPDTEREGLNWLRESAKQGNLEAQYYLGHYLTWYWDTRSKVPEKLRDEGIDWMRQAAENGHVGAQDFLGVSYLIGDCVEKDYDLAVKWSRAAAQQGNVDAQKRLEEIGEFDRNDSTEYTETPNCVLRKKDKKMRKPSAKRAYDEMNADLAEVFVVEHGIGVVEMNGLDKYLYYAEMPEGVEEKTLMIAANEFFHRICLLEEGRELTLDEEAEYCTVHHNEHSGKYFILFNHPFVIEAKASRMDVGETAREFGEAQRKLVVEEEAEEAQGLDENDDGLLTPAQIMKYIADGIKSGEFKSKSGEGYFVLKGEFYDEIKAGRKTTEYRDLTPRNLSKSIGIKTVKLQRGYGHPGQPPEQMRFEVASVGLLDADDRECDPYNIPDGFIATTIAIHLGKRIG